MGRSGEYIKNLSGEAEYRSFRPAPLPPEPGIELNNDLVNILVEASKNLGMLDAAAKHIPNSELFISMYVRKEALLSSQIEGTQCTLDDILDPDMKGNTNLDVADVINYISACTFALNRLEELPLCNRLLKEIHKVLLSGVRGEEKNPGEFRRSQNWIGPANCSLREARYIPPNVEDMDMAMNELEKYINEGRDYDPLISIALIHYQFETIHPFLDGNGRVGRMMILLYLMERNLLTKPIVYISYFLKRNQIEYYDRITEVRRSGNYEQWVCFFLEAVSAAAKDSLESIEKLSELHDRNISKLPASKRSNNTIRRLFDYIEQYPIIDVKRTASALGVSYNTISSAVRKLEEIGILQKTTNASRNRIFIYEEYLEILRKGT